jgi:hypothetical protein
MYNMLVDMQFLSFDKFDCTHKLFTSVHGKALPVYTKVWFENVREIIGVDGRITVGQISCSNTTWIKLPQDRVQWWAYVNMVMHFQFPYKQEFLDQVKV